MSDKKPPPNESIIKEGPFCYWVLGMLDEHVAEGDTYCSGHFAMTYEPDGSRYIRASALLKVDGEWVLIDNQTRDTSTSFGLPGTINLNNDWKLVHGPIRPPRLSEKEIRRREEQGARVEFRFDTL